MVFAERVKQINVTTIGKVNDELYSSELSNGTQGISLSSSPARNVSVGGDLLCEVSVSQTIAINFHNNIIDLYLTATMDSAAGFNTLNGQATFSAVTVG